MLVAEHLIELDRMQKAKHEAMLKAEPKVSKKQHVIEVLGVIAVIFLIALFPIAKYLIGG